MLLPALQKSAMRPVSGGTPTLGAQIMGRYSRFNTGRRNSRTSPIKEFVMKAGRSTTCATCKQKVTPGDEVLKLKVKKRYRQACATCDNTTVSRYFHNTPACIPVDKKKAMGFDPNRARTMHYNCMNCGFTQHTPFGKHCGNCGEDPNNRKNAGGAVPPPPKPKSAEDLTLEAVASLEKAVIAQMTQRKKPMPGHDPVRCKGNRAAGVAPQPCAVCAEFNKWQGIKQRILRPGTPGEGDAALLVGLQRLVKLALS